MSTESNPVAELQVLLDALCEATITPEQQDRLEELVLSHPEAEAHYLGFMGFYADLVESIAGLPAPSLRAAESRIDDTRVEKSSTQSISAERPQPSRVPRPEFPAKESPTTKRFATRWKMAGVAALFVAALGVLAAGEASDWLDRSHAVAEKQTALDARRSKLVRLQAEQWNARAAALKSLEPAQADAQALLRQYEAALTAARQAIEEKEFSVRLTGPARVQPGAPNKWQIETLRRGAIGRPKKLEVLVKDGSGNVLFQQTHDKPVGAATLELSTAFWEKIKPGADLFLEVTAFTDDDRKSVIAERIPLARPVYITHLATDKPLYKPGEMLHFRSLTLDRSSLKPPEHDLHFRFRLRNPAGAVIPVAEGNGRLVNAKLQPVLGPNQQPLRGIGIGEFLVAPNFPGGEYQLEVVEVVANKDVLLETRKFIVARYVPDTFEKKLEFDGKSYGAGDIVQARIEVSRTAGGAMRDARANLVASIDGREFHRQTGARFAIVGDPDRTRALLDVRFKLPADLFERAKSHLPPNAVLSVSIFDGSDAETILRPIPLVAKHLRVDFFPEGGEMIDGVPGRVYFQVRTPAGKPADLQGAITDGTTKLVDVATATDAENPGVNRGHGAFTITPSANKRYFLKIAFPSGIIAPTPDGFPLPIAIADGVALESLDAVTAAGAPIRVRLQVNHGPKTLHVGAYSRGRLISHQRLRIEAGKPVDLSLTGDDEAGGVARLTVFEEPQAEGPSRAALIPRAERLIYRAPARQLTLNVHPDKVRYLPGGKVRLELSAANEKQAATPAVLLVGVVNRSVIAMADNKADRLMPTHFLLSGDVKHPAELEHADFLLTDHPKAAAALDLLLATQGWRRFAEQNRPPANPADKSDVAQMLVAHGQQTTAPLELFKLEEQRVTAEFQPQLEQAQLRVATAEFAASKAAAPLAERVSSATEALADAQFERRQAAEALTRFESWLDKLRSGLGTGLVVVLILVVLYGLCMGALAAMALKPVGRRRPYVAGTVSAILCGLILMVATTTQKNDSPRAAMEVSNREKAAAANALAPAEPLPIDAGGKPPEKPIATLPASPPRVAPSPDPSEDANSFKPIEQLALLNEAKLRMQKAALEFAQRPQQGMMGMRGGMMGMAGGMGGMGGMGMGGMGMGGMGLNGMMGGGMMGGGMMGMGGMGMMGGGMMGMGGMNGMMGGGFGPAGGRPTYPFIVREYAHQRDPRLGAIRADFTETVYWHPALVVPQNGKATVEFQLADDVARYQVLVAGHTTDGRIGAVTKTIEARKPLSLDPKLPLEISHTDVIDMPIRITNDSDARRSVAFTFALNGLKNAGGAQAPFELGANGKGRRIVRLRPDKLRGDASVLVTGISSAADNDTIARTITIVPDGFPGVGSFSDTLQGRARGSVALPRGLVPGSLRVRLEMYPTSMADLVKGLEGLLREPGGCFEQTSSSNYPNTLILDYLNESKQANPEASKRARVMLDRGYSKLVSFECPDTPRRMKQGFEWFGAADRQHEALTAYGLLQFKDMARVHPVDPDLIKRTQTFLLSRKDGAGGFQRNARALDKFGAAPKSTTDAYIVWALVESDPDDAERLDLAKEIAALKAEALDANSVGGRDSYFVALTANILLLRGDRETAHKLLDRLQEERMKDGAVTGAVTSITRSGGRDLQIETTALALLGWMRANDPKYAPAVKEATRWISQQRGGYGGFGSTQSTVMALKALIIHAKKSVHPAESGALRVRVGGKVVAGRKFTEHDLEVIGLDVPNPEAIFNPGERTEAEIATDAKQAYPFALTYTYTTLMPLSAPGCAVRLATKLGKTEARESETVPLAVTLENRQKQGQGMAVAIVGIPAGMKVPTDLKQLTELREHERISFFEIRGRELVLYWRELAPEQKIALTIDLTCEVPGSYRGPASRAYLYYDADHKHWVEPLSVKIAPFQDNKAR